MQIETRDIDNFNSDVEYIIKEYLRNCDIELFVVDDVLVVSLADYNDYNSEVLMRAQIPLSEINLATRKPQIVAKY